MSSHPTVSMGPAPETAIACTAVGCHRSDDLLRVVKDGTVRILCQLHASEWVGR